MAISRRRFVTGILAAGTAAVLTTLPNSETLAAQEPEEPIRRLWALDGTMLKQEPQIVIADVIITVGNDLGEYKRIKVNVREGRLYPGLGEGEFFCPGAGVHMPGFLTIDFKTTEVPVQDGWTLNKIVTVITMHTKETKEWKTELEYLLK